KCGSCNPPVIVDSLYFIVINNAAQDSFFVWPLTSERRHGIANGGSGLRICSALTLRSPPSFDPPHGEERGAAARLEPSGGLRMTGRRLEGRGRPRSGHPILRDARPAAELLRMRWNRWTRRKRTLGPRGHWRCRRRAFWQNEASAKSSAISVHSVSTLMWPK